MSAANAPEPLGSGAFVTGDGESVVTELTAMDRLVIARLQDIEDHPDLILDQAA
ncbi:hypothetical protein Achl_4386 (plasmid) [Pseudarthrobacter chlorophenolicus A6]|uniref:Uncharacterized protein n=1 Tax=Pseudarthrobacter chlorophenolicus (strain ATCC 700700 / DSM 12829 / CIP 107037 / JCM 12360 / KCTC 9906 / NCIMB 13794 / A6) TaxID=452863 RepID=B8HIU0_PSECP|nr:hypothetical protein [Pseudarthrobacter chlorophenolicus]ACL42337.1 hypothetical protein Achl_4386 [Pseudarthrobacter chlorophenolicus A6]SDQ16684.1 hypothetical protein SAMN04489738_0443 [Pseudarthrobacter chlorophenolicus]